MVLHKEDIQVTWWLWYSLFDVNKVNCNKKGSNVSALSNGHGKPGKVFFCPLQDTIIHSFVHLCLGLNASIVYLVDHILQGYFTFSYYFIFHRIVCVLVRTHCDAQHKKFESHYHSILDISSFLKLGIALTTSGQRDHELNLSSKGLKNYTAGHSSDVETMWF